MCRCCFQATSSRLVVKPCAKAIIAKQRICGDLAKNTTACLKPSLDLLPFCFVPVPLMAESLPLVEASLLCLLAAGSECKQPDSALSLLLWLDDGLAPFDEAALLLLLPLLLLLLLAEEKSVVCELLLAELKELLLLPCDLADTCEGVLP